MNRINYFSFVSFLIYTLLLSGMTMAQDKASTLAVNVPEQFSFDDCFLNKTLRIDYFLAGNSSTENVFFREMREEPNYGGPHNDLLALKNTGTYRYMLIDSASGRLVFAKGFSSIFQEWRGTPEAKEISRAFSMVAVMPFPKKTMQFVIEKRSYETGIFQKLFEMRIRPDDYFILKDSIRRLKVETLMYSGVPASHVDVAFLAEGYTEAEINKFIADARSMMDYFLSVEPYSNFRDKFNFYAVISPSEESGVTIPGKELYVNTNIHSSFYTFDMDRYLTSFDTKSIYDIAANVPYDAIFVLVNSKRYGGGGFYNHYCEGTVDNQYSMVVAIHEFGHSFAGLADEYYNAEVTYSDFYNTKTEPWEKNITTNKDFASKWKDLIPLGIPVPTPRKAEYNDVTGMFEGGGYVSKGVYSPSMDCRMKSNEASGFCPVCRKAITEMIEYYAGSGK
ncbi:MAG: M64 family metallo-endopeptidase [Bacteroidetes bacterium]|nr:M64 family metallo-endopeptidase [Bacteroidota bacterium]